MTKRNLYKPSVLLFHFSPHVLSFLVNHMLVKIILQSSCVTADVLSTASIFNRGKNQCPVAISVHLYCYNMHCHAARSCGIYRHYVAQSNSMVMRLSHYLHCNIALDHKNQGNLKYI